MQGTKLDLAVTGLRGVGSAAEDLLCGRLGEEPAENFARRGLSMDALFGWPRRNQKAGSMVPMRWSDAHLKNVWAVINYEISIQVDEICFGCNIELFSYISIEPCSHNTDFLYCISLMSSSPFPPLDESEIVLEAANLPHIFREICTSLGVTSPMLSSETSAMIEATNFQPRFKGKNGVTKLRYQF